MVILLAKLLASDDHSSADVGTVDYGGSFALRRGQLMKSLRPAYGYWKRAAIVVTIPIVLAVSFARGADSQNELDAIAVAALEEARSAGDATPTDVRYVRSTRAAANRLLFAGTMVESDQPVYVVSLRGNFMYNGPRPPEVEPPRGTRLTLIYDARTLELTEHAFGSEVDIAELGAVRPLPEAGN